MTDNIANKIKSGIKEIKPTPKWQFLTWEVIRDILLALIWGSAVLIIGAIVYILAHYDPLDGVPINFDNILKALEDYPWELIILTLLLIVMIYFIAKKIGFLYRLEKRYIFLLIIFTLALGYIIAEELGLNHQISKTTFGENLYLNQGKIIIPQRQGVVLIGKIIGYNNHRLQIENLNGEKQEVIIAGNTQLVGERHLSVGDYIKINTINTTGNQKVAYLVEKINENWRGFITKVKKETKLECINCTK